MSVHCMQKSCAPLHSWTFVAPHDFFRHRVVDRCNDPTADVGHRATPCATRRSLRSAQPAATLVPLGICRSVTRCPILKAMSTNSIDTRRPAREKARPGPAQEQRRTSWAAGDVAFAWGVMGVVVLFATAVLRLSARGLATVSAGLTGWQWLALAALTALFVYGEGVRALQRKWVPWALGRLVALREERRTWYLLLAPLHAMAFIGAPARTLVRAWAGSVAIVVAVMIVSRFPEPWRGITDIAVASALAWATVVLVVGGMRRLH
jgi:hypothetical protein